MLGAVGTKASTAELAPLFVSTSALRRLRAATALWRAHPPVAAPPARTPTKRALIDTTTEGIRALQRWGGLRPLSDLASLTALCVDAVVANCVDPAYLGECVLRIPPQLLQTVVMSLGSAGHLSAAHLDVLRGSSVQRVVAYGAGIPEHRLDSLADFPRLTDLQLSSVFWLTDELLVEVLQGLPQLVRLSVDRCKHVSDASLSVALPTLPHLAHLSVSGTRASVATFAVAPLELESLDASCLFQPFSDTDAAALQARGCRKIEFLLVSSTKLTGVGATTLMQCVSPDLHTLSMAFNTRMSDWGCLATGTRVVDLDLSLNHSVDDGVIAVIGRSMPSLVYLNLEKTDITSACAPSLARLTQLHTLDLRRTAVDDRIGPALAALPHLRGLMLAYTMVTDDLAMTIAQIPALRTLKLTGCTGITDAGVRALGASLHLPYTLLGLDVGGGGITNAAAEALPQLRKLESLQLWETEVSTPVAHQLVAALGMVIDDQIRCTKGTWIMLSKLRLMGRDTAWLPPVSGV